MAVSYNLKKESICFGKRLKQILEERQITVSNLSEKTGIQTNTIYRYLRNENRVPSPIYGINIADALNCSLDYLLGLKDEDTTTKTRENVKPEDALDGIMDEFERAVLLKRQTNIYRLSLEYKGISYTSIYEYSNDKHKPTLTNIFALADTIQCSIDYLLKRDPIAGQDKELYPGI